MVVGEVLGKWVGDMSFGVVGKWVGEGVGGIVS